MSPDARPLLAILPFSNLGASPGDEYLADGLAEEVFARLARLESLRVIAPASTLQYRDTRTSLAEIAGDRGVSALLEGSVCRNGESVRVTVRVVDARKGTPLWSGTYDWPLDKLPAISDDIASQIAEVFDTRAVGSLAPVPPAREAYESYLKGRYFWNRRTADGLRRAITYFSQAIATAPDYALAHTGLADASLLLVEYASMPPKEAVPAARESVLKAIEIDDGLAAAHATLGAIHCLFDWDAGSAERSFRRSLELSPGYATAHHWHAIHLAACGRFEEALSEIHLAQENDPLSPILGSAAGWIRYAANRPELAVAEVDKSFEIDPGFAPGHLVLGLAHLRMGQTDPALAALERAAALSGQQPRVLGLLGYAYALAAETGAARAVLDQLMVLAEGSYVPASRVALVHGALGDGDRMREWLTRGVEERDMLLPYASAILADQPRLAEVLRQSGFSYGADAA